MIKCAGPDVVGIRLLLSKEGYGFYNSFRRGCHSRLSEPTSTISLFSFLLFNKFSGFLHLVITNRQKVKFIFLEV